MRNKAIRAEGKSEIEAQVEAEAEEEIYARDPADDFFSYEDLLAEMLYLGFEDKDEP